MTCWVTEWSALCQCLDEIWGIYCTCGLICWLVVEYKTTVDAGQTVSTRMCICQQRLFTWSLVSSILHMDKLCSDAGRKYNCKGNRKTFCFRTYVLLSCLKLAKEIKRTDECHFCMCHVELAWLQSVEQNTMTMFLFRPRQRSSLRHFVSSVIIMTSDWYSHDFKDHSINDTALYETVHMCLTFDDTELRKTVHMCLTCNHLSLWLHLALHVSVPSTIAMTFKVISSFSCLCKYDYFGLN